MSGVVIGALGLAAMLVLLALRMPVGLSMLAVGFAGTASINGLPSALSIIGTEPVATLSNSELVVIPLFVLMGNLATASGLSRDLYAAAYVWIGHFRGGLASATIAACAGFAALCGSSVAAAVTMGQVSLPEMRRYGYAPSLAAGSVAAGGTLGILIPPSTGFVLYAILTEQSVGRLFLAGVLPGLLLTVLFIAAIVIVSHLRPEVGPPGPRTTFREKLKATGQAAPMTGVILLTIGGIYAGWFTANEASGIGASLAFLIAIARRKLGVKEFISIGLQSAQTTALVFLILVGAQVFNPFLALTQIPSQLAEFLSSLNVAPLVLLMLIIAIYIFLGMFLEGLAMLVLTVPIVFPIITAIGYDPIWFGVVMVLVLEMGLISPPVGVNVFVVKGLVPDVPIEQIFRGIIPFWLAMIVCLALLITFPDIALILPQTMKQ